MSDLYISQLLARLREQFPAMPRFLAQVHDLAESLEAGGTQEPRCLAAAILPRLLQPVRAVRLGLVWTDDTGQVQVTEAYVINYVNLHPSACGLYFQPDVTADGMMARGLASLWENALAGQQSSAVVGAAADLNRLSDRESMELCRSFVRGVLPLISPAVLGQACAALPRRERGYLTGQLRAMTGCVCPAPATPFTPPQAIGYGLCFFVQAALQTYRVAGLNGKTVLVLGGGKAAVYAAQKATQLGAHVTAIGDDRGYLHGARLPLSALNRLLTTPPDDTMEGYCREPDTIWDIAADVVLLCSPRLSIDGAQAQRLAAHGLEAAAEGFSMVCGSQARAVWGEAGVLFCPGAAAGAGAALAEGLAEPLSVWDGDKRLRAAMRGVLQSLRQTHPENLTHAAHLTAVKRLALMLLEQGVT